MVIFENLIDGGAVVTEDYGLGQPFQPCPGLFNPGIDLAAPCGAIIRALGYGVVLSVGEPCWAGPNAVIVRSGGVDILFAHTSAALVTPGQAVGPRDGLARIGSMTGGPCCGVIGADPCAASRNCGGVATGPHTHMQVNRAGVDFTSHYCSGIDPGPYLVSWPGAAPAAPPGPAPPPGFPAPEYGLTLQGALIALAGVGLGALVVRDSYRKLALKGKLGGSKMAAVR